MCRNKTETPSLTEQEWHLLIRQDDPEGWHALGGDLVSWKLKVERVCARHGCAIEGELTMDRFTNTVFFTSNLVIKVFAWRSIWFERELESLQVLEQVPQANTPRLLGYGDAIDDEDAGHPYLIMERLPGESYYNCRDHLSIEEKCTIASQLAERVLAMHETPIVELRPFEKRPEEWVRLIRTRAALWEELKTDKVPFLSNMPPYLRAQIPAFIAKSLPYVTEDFRPSLISADLNAWNILIAKEDSAWCVTGHIDFGYAEVGPVEYEWVSLCQKAFGGNETLMRTFLMAYGWQLPVPHEVKQRLKLYTLLHRFPALRLPPKEATEGPSLEAILDAHWPI